VTQIDENTIVSRLVKPSASPKVAKKKVAKKKAARKKVSKK
jgi:hypothetical protein